MTVNWDAVASLSGLVAALVAIIALIRQTRQTAFVAGVELLFSMYERFFSAEMLANRRRAATDWRERHHGGLQRGASHGCRVGRALHVVAAVVHCAAAIIGTGRR